MPSASSASFEGGHGGGAPLWPVLACVQRNATYTDLVAASKLRVADALLVSAEAGTAATTGGARARERQRA